MTFHDLDIEKKNKIINATCEIFSKYGYKKASIKDIADLAEVSKSVLFKYFSTKENLYITIFRLASDSIHKADEIAYAAQTNGSDMFDLMRLSGKSRLSLFKEYPWIYKFSYTAFFDNDPFVKELVKKEMESYKDYPNNSSDFHTNNYSMADKFVGFNGLRDDISPSTAKQIILWISMGYLEDKLNIGEIDPNGLERGFEEWMNTLEKILKDKKISNEKYMER